MKIFNKKEKKKWNEQSANLYANPPACSASIAPRPPTRTHLGHDTLTPCLFFFSFSAHLVAHHSFTDFSLN